MFLFSWPRNRKTHSRAIARCRPRLELLEDRAVPAVLNVTTTVDVINPDDGQLSLREAVIQANGSSAAEIINLPAGTYRLAIAGAEESASHTGDLNVTGHVMIRGAGLGATVIDAVGLDRVFTFLDSTATLSDMSIRGGYSDSEGGGIVNTGQLTLNRCSVTDNIADGWQGGGISNYGALTITGSTISGNSSLGAYGGGIFNAGSLTVRETQVSNNSGYIAAGIYNSGQLNVSKCVLSGNSAIIEEPGDDLYNAGSSYSVFVHDSIIGDRYDE